MKKDMAEKTAEMEWNENAAVPQDEMAAASEQPAGEEIPDAEDQEAENINPAVRLATMREMFLHAQRLYSWRLDCELHLLESNCPGRDFFYNLFLISYCSDAILEHVGSSEYPCVVNDRLV